MDLVAVGDSPIGQLVPVSGQDARWGDFEYHAYLPQALPADVVLSSTTWSAVTKASAALAKLDQACLQLPDPRLLIRPTLFREALDTSALEGTVGVLQDLLEAQLPSTQYLSPETLEIRAYERVALRAFREMEHRSISVALLCELQEELFQEARRPIRGRGAIRDELVWIGPQDRPITESRFVPAPGDDRLKAGLRAWEEWIHAESLPLPPVLRAALAHYQFETLHPFGDGNGRLGRLVIVLQLLQAGSLSQPAMTVSTWLRRHRQQYQDHLLAVTCSGDWNPWVQFFCDALVAQCGSVLPAATDLIRWLEEARRQVHSRRWTGAIHRLLEDLIEWPVTSVADTASRYDVTTMNATRMINHLVEIGVLRELTGRNYGRMFGATEVMNIIEAI